MDLIELPTLPEIPAVQSIACAELNRVNAALARRVEEHKTRFAAFWRNYYHTPDSILESMGSQAVVWLAAANESAEHIGRLAAIVGKIVSDFLPDEDRVPPRAFIIGPSPDYVVTLASPEEGQDAWGNPIAQPDQQQNNEI